MPEVKWIKFKVGTFDGMSFKRIKNAKIGGISYRDKLTAVWFELMEFAGKCNQEGAFINPDGSPVYNLSDIALAIDRDIEELELCVSFYIKEGMVSLANDTYALSNWHKHQNVIGLGRLKEQNQTREYEFSFQPDVCAECEPTPEPPPPPQEPLFTQERKRELRENFKRVWEAYPRKENKQLAWEEFKKLNLPNSLMEKIILAIEMQKYKDKWQEENGRYIPSLHNWLSGKRWQDEVDEKTKNDYENDLLREEHQKRMWEEFWK